ncbi:hypothetical protein EVG20_g855 [Dentipellis fragilis]|uniref:Peptidase A1 domain-containing protein n=1 Tax=Dentipellis fragilis TaxID=205917 RepID=A0A4Y9ZEB4_9AGAM|nr:hypothetical protein EVG20_g855 [Dentipellis fragilis]
MRSTFSFEALSAAIFILLSIPVEVWAIPFPHDHGLPASHVATPTNLSEVISSPANLTRRAPPPLTIPLAILANSGQDQGYIASIRVGSNPRPFTVLMDSGSSEFWVISEICRQRGRRNAIGTASSPLIADLGVRWGTGYEDGSTLSGTVVRDTVVIGDRTIRGFPFGAAQTLTDTLVTGIYDGIMGFGLSSVSRTGAPTPLEAMAGSLIPDAITGWKLARSADGRNDAEITLGGQNTAKFHPDSQVIVPNTSRGRSTTWRFTIDKIMMNGRTITDARVGIVDTGSSALFVNHEDALAVLGQIRGLVALKNGEFAIPCNARPQLALVIGRVPFSVDPRDIVGVPIGGGLCLANIVSDVKRKPGEWLVSIPFLKNVYLTLDVTGNQIGFAELR